MKKRGFTLIELIAVIVILTIIALIATPIVLNIIKGTKISAIERTAANYIETVNTAVTERQLSDKKTADGAYPIISDGDNVGNICLEGTVTDCSDILIIEISGTRPNGGTIVIEKGIVVAVLSTDNTKTTSIILPNYVVVYDNGKLVATETSSDSGSGGGTPNTVYGVGDLVYFDPVNDKSSCSSDSDVYSSQGTSGYGTDSTSTCYKWRVIETEDDDSKDSITLQMDHNLINIIAWISGSDYTTANIYGQSNSGYWTLSPVSNAPRYTWTVNYTGQLYGFNGVTEDVYHYGIRPVITIPKSSI